MDSTGKYDTIIIGAGIAGLYAAYKIKKQDPHHNLIILERENHIGGRMGTVNFHGTQIAIGAGVGRKRKDKLLQKLLQELRIPTHEFKTSTNYAETLEPCDVKRTFEYLKETYEKQKPPKNINFQEFATKILGKHQYEHFITCAGYTDYENEAASNTFTHYGFNDNYQQSWTAIGIPWQKLLQSLQNYIGRTHIHTNQTVTKIQQINDKGSFASARVETPNMSLTGVVWSEARSDSTTNSEGCVAPRRVWQVKTNNSEKYQTTRLIVATTIDTVHRLIPESKNPTNSLSTIKGQPFLRIYGKFTPESNKIIQQYVTTTTIVPGPIHKLIPINTKQGIYMIVYTDNKGAKFLKKYTANTPQNRESLCKYLQEALGITQPLVLEDIRSFYWPIGTHYYTQNNQENIPQNPKPNLFIIGEMISHNQGWVEGALESVNNIHQ